MEEKIAICPGSFDPITCGHLDIIKRSSKLFSKVIVVILVNSSKNTSFSIEERKVLIEKTVKNLKNVSVDTHEGLLVDYAKKSGASAIIRGLRAVTDFDYEFQMALINKKMYPGADTIYLNTSSEYLYLSSSLVKEIAKFGGDISDFIPDVIYEEVEKRLGQNKGNIPKERKD